MKLSKRWAVINAVGAVCIALLCYLLVMLSKQYSSMIIENRSTQLQIICKTVSTNLGLGIQRDVNNFLYFVHTDVLGLTDDFPQEKAAQEKRRQELYSIFCSYKRYNQDSISNIVLTKKGSDVPIISLTQNTYTLFHELGAQDGRKMTLYFGEPNTLYLAIHFPLQNGYVITSYIDMNILYEQYVSFIKLGNKGYIMVKDHEGVVIMHPLKEQIGVNAATGRQQLYPGVTLKLDSLQKMIEHQKQGQEGSDIYYSYWWPDKANIKLIKKISAYAPFHIGDTFFIISAVTDYEEIAQHIRTNLLTLISLSLLLFAIILVPTIVVIFVFNRTATVEKENSYLRQLNETLNTLHKNEQIISHGQRLDLIGTMTGGIAHEFNNLLTPIMGYSGLLMQTMDKNDPNYDDITEIFDAAGKARDIIQQISQLSKNNLDVVYKYCDTKELLTQAVKMAGAIKTVNIELSLMIEDNVTGLFGNMTQLNQILLNLFVNAFHAIGTEQPGFVRISCRNTSKRELMYIVPQEQRKNLDEKNTDYVEISILDNGCGMSPQVMDKIFDPFFTTKSKGTGLGLFVVQNIITAHRGVILCDSSEGKSTEFKILLPAALSNAGSPQGAGPAESAVTEQYCSGLNVLIVDDNRRVLKVLQKGLEQYQNNVTSLDSSTEALKLLESQKFSILITDNSMKDLTGIDLAIKARQLNPDMPIIIITGFLTRAVIEAKQTHIIDDYYVKPLIMQQLISAVYTLTGHGPEGQTPR